MRDHTTTLAVRDAMCVTTVCLDKSEGLPFPQLDRWDNSNLHTSISSATCKMAIQVRVRSGRRASIRRSVMKKEPVTGVQRIQTSDDVHYI